MSLSKERIIQTYKENVDRLIALNPTVFNKDFPLPLKVGIYADVKRMLGLPARQTSALLLCWCSRWEYACMSVSGHMRRDIDGKIVDRGDNYVDPLRKRFVKRHLSKSKREAFNQAHLMEFGFEAFSAMTSR